MENFLTISYFLSLVHNIDTLIHTTCNFIIITKFHFSEPVDFSRNESQNNSRASSGNTGGGGNGSSQNDKNFSIYSSLHHQMGGSTKNGKNDIMRPRPSRSNDLLSDDNSDDGDDDDDCSDVDIVGDGKVFI